jgi:hypothetical protein
VRVGSPSAASIRAWSIAAAARPWRSRARACGRTSAACGRPSGRATPPSRAGFGAAGFGDARAAWRRRRARSGGSPRATSPWPSYRPRRWRSDVVSRAAARRLTTNRPIRRAVSG